MQICECNLQNTITFLYSYFCVVIASSYFDVVNDTCDRVLSQQYYQLVMVSLIVNGVITYNKCDGLLMC